MNSTLTRVAARATGLVAVAAMLTACGAQERTEGAVSQEVADRAPAEDVDAREDDTGVTTEDGTDDASSGDGLPEGWPSSLPIPRDGRITTASSYGSDDSVEMHVVLQYDGDFDDIRAEIEDGIVGTEWTLSGEASTAEEEGTRIWSQGYVAGDLDAHVSVMEREGRLTLGWAVEGGGGA